MTSFLANGRSIIAIGRNYAAHAKELGNAVPKEPFWFLKPTSSYVSSPGEILVPRGVNAHHEVELAIVIGKGGKNIPTAMAMEHISGYALAIDVTARNVQEEAKSKGLPWTISKGFDTFTPIGSFVPNSAVHDPHCLKLWLKVNGAIKQSGNTGDMIFKIPALLHKISSVMTLQENDIILTGTPPGVGQMDPGDRITAGLETDDGSTLSEIEFTAKLREEGYHYS